MDAQVSAENLGKIYRVGFWGRRVRAVEDLTFQVKQGEIFGLLGPNGAGKTTTIKMLLGFVRPTAGRGFICGAPIGSVQSRRKLGYLPENPALYEFLRGDEYLTFAGRLAGLSQGDARRQAAGLLERVGLAGRADKPIRKFSKGMVQRLALAQALVGDPQTVILDEPMSGLDPIGRKDVRDLILQLRDEGRTVLFSTHILSDVEAICDRVAILVEGRLTDCGSLTDLVAPGARSVELIVDGAPAELSERLRAAGAGVLHRDRSTVFTFADEAPARQALQAALAAGATVVAFTPHRRSLEELFVARARGKAATS
ncbi:MAG TPA: ABC transporter ATP-binding protein [Myxococcales bacterium]|nr:ABC transporter ATP-binding protein [Myxococcales bacterium]